MAAPIKIYRIFFIASPVKTRVYFLTMDQSFQITQIRILMECDFSPRPFKILTKRFILTFAPDIDTDEGDPGRIQTSGNH